APTRRLDPPLTSGAIASGSSLAQAWAVGTRAPTRSPPPERGRACPGLDPGSTREARRVGVTSSRRRPPPGRDPDQVRGRGHLPPFRSRDSKRPISAKTRTREDIPAENKTTRGIVIWDCPVGPVAEFDILPRGAPGLGESDVVRSIATARVHHGPRRRGRVAAGGARAAACQPATRRGAPCL